jgi:hypothetical protein
MPAAAHMKVESSAVRRELRETLAEAFLADKE